MQFFIRRFRGPAPYAATMRAPYGRTAVQVVKGRNASTGAASAFYVATSGSVTVMSGRTLADEATVPSSAVACTRSCGSRVDRSGWASTVRGTTASSRRRTAARPCGSRCGSEAPESRVGQRSRMSLEGTVEPRTRHRRTGGLWRVERELSQLDQSGVGRHEATSVEVESLEISRGPRRGLSSG